MVTWSLRMEKLTMSKVKVRDLGIEECYEGETIDRYEQPSIQYLQKSKAECNKIIEKLKTMQLGLEDNGVDKNWDYIQELSELSEKVKVISEKLAPMKQEDEEEPEVEEIEPEEYPNSSDYEVKRDSSGWIREDYS